MPNRDLADGSDRPRSYLLILGDRVALAWVLATEQMAFSRQRVREVSVLAVGDELLLYSTRGAYYNPTRDRGRVFGLATVASEVSELDDPPAFGARTFELGCSITVSALAPLREGVELQPLVGQLESLPTGAGWGVRLRRPLVPLTYGDAELLRGELAATEQPPQDVLADYLAAGVPAGSLGEAQ